MRSIRNQPFCWQEKSIFRLFRKTFEKFELVKMRTLYDTITEIDSDFNGKEIKYYTNTIHTYSGLSKDWIPKGLKELEKLKIIKMVAEREKGKYKGKKLIFIGKMPTETITGESTNGESINGKKDTSEHISSLEHIYIPEEINNIPSNLISYSKEFLERQQNNYPNLIKNITKEKIEAGAKELEKLIRIDKYDFEEIRKVLDWAIIDGFWSTNILSLASIRNKSKSNKLSKFVNIYTSYLNKDKQTNKEHYNQDNTFVPKSLQNNTDFRRENLKITVIE